jgi:hypothetical protein
VHVASMVSLLGNETMDALAYIGCPYPLE